MACCLPRLDEQIGLLRRLWAEPLVTFEGRFDRLERACINPRPRRQNPNLGRGAARVVETAERWHAARSTHLAVLTIKLALDTARRPPRLRPFGQGRPRNTIRPRAVTKAIG